MSIATPVHVHANAKHGKIAQRLIDLSGVTWLCEHRLGPLHILVDVTDELKAPWLASGSAIDFVIHEVANANQSPHQTNGNTQAVKSPQSALLGHMPAKDENSNDNANGATMACQTAFPHLEDVGRMLAVVTPVVEEHMP